jgi:nitric oxide reductase subunit B
MGLLYRATAPALKDPERREITQLFLGGAAAIPFFYLPAFFFGSTTNFTVVDMWRFWIIHLWVEGFFELFVTILVAVTFYQLGVVRRINVVRVIYMDAILFLAGGIIGTAHHWYWTGQANFTMALAAMFSALEVVPLTLLTLDAWDFVKLTGTGNPTGAAKRGIPHKWAFYFLMAVGFWNFVGAGIFGFLINMPVVSYYEAGTILTLNHGHAALLGAFGMLAMALLVLGLRHVLTDEQWTLPEKFVKVSFWGINIGLALMVITNLFPEGILQIWDVLENGYWHARSLEFIGSDRIRALEWVSMPSHVILIVVGVVPMVIASGLTYLKIRKSWFQWSSGNSNDHAAGGPTGRLRPSFSGLSLLIRIHFFPMHASSEQASFPPTDMLVPEDFFPLLSGCEASAGLSVMGFTVLPIQASSSHTSLLDTDMDDRKLRSFVLSLLGGVFMAGLLQLKYFIN